MLEWCKVRQWVLSQDHSSFQHHEGLLTDNIKSFPVGRLLYKFQVTHLSILQACEDYECFQQPVSVPLDFARTLCLP